MTRLLHLVTALIALSGCDTTSPELVLGGKVGEVSMPIFAAGDHVHEAPERFMPDVEPSSAPEGFSASHERVHVELPVIVVLPPSMANSNQYALEPWTAEDMEPLVLAQLERANDILEDTAVEFVLENIVYGSEHPIHVDASTPVETFAHDSRAIVVYLVESLDAAGDPLTGYAVADVDGCRPFVLLDPSSAAFTLAHELGHVLGLGHRDDLEGNLMEHFTHDVNLVRYQRDTMNANALRLHTTCGFSA